MLSGVIYPYRFSTGTSAPPGEAQVRANQDFGSLVSTIWLHNKNDDNVDVHIVLMRVSAGSEVSFQDKTNHANAYTYTATAKAIDQGTYVEIPVTFVQSSGIAFTGNQQILALLYAATPDEPGTGTEPQPPGSEPFDFSHIVLTVPLVSLSVAKDHLHITNTAHDADITQKLEAAQDQILAKLGLAADPAWTESTVPRPVRHAILLLLDAFYERRGGDEANDSLRKAFDAIDLVLALYRDPTLA